MFREDKVTRSVVLVGGSQHLWTWILQLRSKPLASFQTPADRKTVLRADKFSTSIMFSPGGLGGLSTPEKLVGDVKRQTGPQETREPAESLSLSRTGLTHVANWVLKNSTLKYLYLEGNRISDIPHSFFASLPKLLWLDLRNNQIASLPAPIGSHRALKALLLEGNPISELPPELGHVISLSGLNLRYCPITFPPADVVHQGVQSILQYLRSAMATRGRPPPLELPVMEKLQLTEAMESSGEEQDLVDEEELQRFRELKHRMILLDKAELSSAASRNKTSLLAATNRKKAASGTGLVPELPLLGSLRLEKPERKQPAKEETLTEPRRRYLETPHKWRTESKITQEKGISNPWEPGKQRQGKEVLSDWTPLLRDSDDSSHPPEQKTRSARALEQQRRGAGIPGVQARSRWHWQSGV